MVQKTLLAHLINFSTVQIHLHYPLLPFLYCCKITVLALSVFFLVCFFFVPHYSCCVLCLSVIARNASVPPERLDAVRKLAASLQCPLLFAEDQVCFQPQSNRLSFKAVLGGIEHSLNPVELTTGAKKVSPNSVTLCVKIK